MKRKFIKSGVRAGAATMAVVLGSGSILLSDPMVVHAQNSEIVQKSLIETETEKTTQPEETPKREETQPEETKLEEDIQKELQKEGTSETEGLEESRETEAAQVYAEGIASSGAVINENTIWNYLDNNIDPAEGLESRQAWTTKEVNDSAWKSTAGRFGAKKGELVSFDGFTPTILLQQYIDGTTTDIPTFFFRTKFNIENLEEVGTITGQLFHDDGVVVYLNGNEIYRSGMVVKNDADPAATNMYYAGENGGAPKEANITVKEEDVQKYAVEGENVLAVELHNDRETSSDVYFEFAELMVNQKTEAPQDVTQKSVFLTVGSDESSRNLTWYANAEEAGEVQYAPKAADGEFPAEFQTVIATATAANDKDFYSNQATLANLKENTEYVYRVKNGETVSDTYSFRTEKKDGSFKFAFVGDPQIGAGSISKDIEGWNATVGIIKDTLNSEFILSAGDQVNTATNEEQYIGYLNATFAGLPSATSVGNHDSASAAYQEHFNLPNESGKGATAAGSDYWYVYGNTLFMDLNTNNKSAEEHKAFMEEAIAANPDVQWKTVVFHHSVYSTASHVNDDEIVSWRNSLPPIFEELGIDVVLMGHDHVYTRTYMMDGKQQHAEADQKAEDKEWVNPKGILYLTANSASGSKYYDIKAADAAYSAKMDQSRRRTVTDVEVTDTTYTVKTYYADDMSVLDEFTIKKEGEKPTPETVDKSKLEEVIKDAAEKTEKDYTAESWKAFKEAYEGAQKVEADKDATQEEIDAAKASLETAMKNLVKEEGEKPTPETVDKSKLEEVIKDAAEKTEKDYTAESWKAFKEAYEGAQKVEADKDATQEKVDEAKASLETAMSKLVKKTAIKPGMNANNGKPDSNVSSEVKTGDSSKPILMSLLMLVSGSFAVLVNKKRKLIK